MKATEFEFRRQKPIHLPLVGTAALTYLIDGEDVVWRFVKNSAASHVWERAAFVAAALLMAIGAGLCTWARAHEVTGRAAVEAPPLQRRYLGEFCYAIGLGSLLPLAGFVILVALEGLRLMRWSGRTANNSQGAPPPTEALNPKWSSTLGKEAVKWGILATMIVFVVTRKDRYADVLVVASFVVGSLLNIPL